MSDDLRVTDSVVIPESELTWRFSRSSGPGGQSVNTSDTRVEVRFDIEESRALSAHQKARVVDRLAGRLTDGVLTIASSEQRSQWQNRQAVRSRLRETLASALAPPPPRRRATRPSRSSVEKRLSSKRLRSRTKQLRRGTGD